jgi:hypothetical protein
VSGPGEKFALGAAPPEQHFAATPTHLPEAYGTQRLFLTARDSNWIYARWDFTQKQLSHYNRLSADQHLVLRMHTVEAKGAPVSETHVHPESRHWFVHVEKPGAQYAAELGYYRDSEQGRRWMPVAKSDPVFTPPASLSPNTRVEFATIPLDTPFNELRSAVSNELPADLPLAVALSALRRAAAPCLTPEQEHALAQAVSVSATQHLLRGSLDILELLRGQSPDASSAAVMEFSLPSSPGAVSSVSSPVGGAQPQKGFWFKVNAELIVYGSTEPNAKVTVAGRPITLRPDGTFSFRFALPDGEYELPVTAVSADATEGRAVELKFARATQTHGDVGVHPQNPDLKPLQPGNVRRR